jgi:DNA-binding MarR family transcriptional regulator
VNALISARAQFSEVSKTLSSELSLGPRGPWIIGLLGKSSMSPLALSGYFSVGRSLITAELNRLADAGLINQEKCSRDGRRILLSLTPSGNQLYARLGIELERVLAGRLAGYTREEILLCAKLLADFAKNDVELRSVDAPALALLDRKL